MFIMHIHRQTCRNCGRNESLTQVYEASEIPAPGKAQKLTHAASVGPVDPVARVLLPYKLIPICSECMTDDAARNGHELYARWQETLARKSQERAAPPTAHREPKERGTRLEDLA